MDTSSRRARAVVSSETPFCSGVVAIAGGDEETVASWSGANLNATCTIVAPTEQSGECAAHTRPALAGRHVTLILGKEAGEDACHGTHELIAKSWRCT